jgi:hypothetical protein
MDAYNLGLVFTPVVFGDEESTMLQPLTKVRVISMVR